MQYAIYATDGHEEAHIGVGRFWFTAVRQFEKMDKTGIKRAKLIMITDSGKKLDTIIQYPKGTKP